MAEPLPPALRSAVARTLTPVTPLASPARRAALLLPVAAVLLVGVPFAWSLRDDATAVGTLRLFGGSLVQVAVGIFTVSVALAEAVPGRLGGLRRTLGATLLGLAVVVGLTLATFLASPTHVPPTAASAYARVCFTHPFLIGLVPLGVALVLIARGLATRPILAGAIAGLGAGLLTDSSWRLFCEVSDPAHVLTAHAGAVVALALTGAAAGAFLRRREAPP